LVVCTIYPEDVVFSVPSSNQKSRWGQGCILLVLTSLFILQPEDHRPMWYIHNYNWLP